MRRTLSPASTTVNHGQSVYGVRPKSARSLRVEWQRRLPCSLEGRPRRCIFAEEIKQRTICSISTDEYLLTYMLFNAMLPREFARHVRKLFLFNRHHLGHNPTPATPLKSNPCAFARCNLPRITSLRKNQGGYPRRPHSRFGTRAISGSPVSAPSTTACPPLVNPSRVCDNPLLLPAELTRRT